MKKKQTLSELSEIVFAAPSRIHGKGLYARVEIEAGAFIGTYEGFRVFRDGRHVLWVNEDGGPEQGRKGTNLLRFMNHADDPVAELDGYDLYASTDIGVGEEITINYGEGWT